MTDSGDKEDRYARMKSKIFDLFQKNQGHPDLVEFDEEHFEKYPATKIPERKLTVRQCELMVMYIAKRQSEPDFDTLACLSFLAFNSLMDAIDNNCLFINGQQDNSASAVPLFHKSKHLKEDWLTLNGTSKLFPDSLMQELSVMDEDGEFESVKLICTCPDIDDYHKMDEIGCWAIRFLEFLAIKDVEARREYAETRKFHYSGENSIYKLPEIALSELVSLPMKRETLYLFYRSIIILNSYPKHLHIYKQYNRLMELGFDKLSRFNQELVAQFHHLFKEKHLERTADLFLEYLLNQLTDELVHLIGPIECLAYHWISTMFRSRYAEYARLFDQKYYAPLALENNRLLLWILIGMSQGKLAPQLEVNNVKCDAVELARAQRFGTIIRLCVAADI